MARSVNDEKICALNELQRNIAHHYQWSLNLNRTLVCGTPPKDDTLREDAHCRCKLGRWLNGRGKQYFQNHPRFNTIIEHHKEMHDLARELANSAMREEKISEKAYDAYQDAQSRLRDEIQATHKELHDEIVSTDPLTGAETRTTMQERLNERISSAKYGQIQDWLIMMDLDHFKAVNDTYGHATGDVVLTAVAATVRRQIRANDLFFRYGGEEFLLCISNVDESKMQEISDRIRKSIELTLIKATDGACLSVTASFGVFGLTPDVSVEEAINKADKALYEAKNAGRNCVRFFYDQNYLTAAAATG
ncbi:diguanylate cyclase [Labrenzia sp. PHM005]|uniref:diguanylate cyclase n=1 Tax=Labrenzia sp. PHM005 TaxID=2590016 RepID=UPI00143D2A13|nr:diguanylate cyclase [Labrenzia sp. PHM005]